MRLVWWWLCCCNGSHLSCVHQQSAEGLRCYNVSSGGFCNLLPDGAQESVDRCKWDDFDFGDLDEN